MSRPVSACTGTAAPSSRRGTWAGAAPCVRDSSVMLALVVALRRAAPARSLRRRLNGRAARASRRPQGARQGRERPESATGAHHQHAALERARAVPPATSRGGGNAANRDRAAGCAGFSTGWRSPAATSCGWSARGSQRCSRSISSASSECAGCRGVLRRSFRRATCAISTFVPRACPTTSARAALAQLWEQGEQRAALCAVVPRLAIAPRARAQRADSRVVDGRRLPCARASRGSPRRVRATRRGSSRRGERRYMAAAAGSPAPCARFAVSSPAL